jgi:hypothetical protein
MLPSLQALAEEASRLEGKNSSVKGQNTEGRCDRTAVRRESSAWKNIKGNRIHTLEGSTSGTASSLNELSVVPALDGASLARGGMFFFVSTDLETERVQIPIRGFCICESREEWGAEDEEIE